jgi:hypothetical protein
MVKEGKNMNIQVSTWFSEGRNNKRSFPVKEIKNAKQGIQKMSTIEK